MAQVGHLERKTRGLLSANVRAFGRDGAVRFQFRATVPKIEHLEVILFTIDRDPSRPSSAEDLEEIRAHFKDADTVRALRNMYSIALSAPEQWSDEPMKALAEEP